MSAAAHVGDMVFFPAKGTYPIGSGGPMWVDQGRPVAHIGDIVICPGVPGVIISGAPRTIDSGRPVARIGDHAYSPDCQIGVIISGNTQCILM